MKVLKASKSAPPVGAIIVSKVTKSGVKVEWGTDTSMDVGDGVVLQTSASIIRYFARSAPSSNLYTDGAISRTTVDHWLTFSIGQLACATEFASALKYLNEYVAPKKYLVGDAATAADYAVFGALFASPYWRGQLAAKTTEANLTKWYTWMEALPEVKSALADLPKDVIPKAAALPAASAGSAKKGGKPSNDNKPKQTKDEGKFVELPGAEMGKVVTRFPPEASGYLHIGHAKAAMLNQHYRDAFKGKLILRFDDTNPAKEKEEFEEVILHDLKLLQVKYDHFSRTSDHFETMLNYCEKLIKDGKAYVDDTDAETVKAERMDRIDSKHRNNTPAVNLKMWTEMKKASEAGQKCAVRAKMNMQSDNGAMRDPAIYRCKNEPHPSTGTKYKVYPTYDFACPIVDSIEGVTHALRTTEYMDRDEQFFWFIDALGLRKPHVCAYSRLSMTNTVMSKRKLTWFAETNQVDGWDDPRFPTVRGVLRRGLTIEALKKFILAQGSSRSVVFMEWDKIWAMNKKEIDPVAPRFSAVNKDNVVVNVSGAKEESVQADKHPKDPTIGQKTVWRSTRVLIDAADAETLKEGENTTFVNWGNLMIKSINRSGGKVTSVDADLNLADTNFKKTLKVTWLAETEKAPFTPTTLVYYDHLITKAVLETGDDFKDFIGTDTKFEAEAVGDPELRKLNKGDIIQIQRKGFFIVDADYKAPTPNTCRPSPIRLIAIPDGSTGSYGRPGKALPPTTGANKAEKKTGAAAQPAKKAAAAPVAAAAPSAGGNAGKINADVIAAGDKVRQLKGDKADKGTIKAAVDSLLALKASYKAATGSEWKPGCTPPAAAAPAAAAAAPANCGDAASINAQVIAAGDKVRQLKGDKADKGTIKSAVDSLLALKASYKSATGSEWKPGCTPPAAAAPAAAPAAAAPAAGGDAASINAQVIAAGDQVRQLKGDKADKGTIKAALDALLGLKASYKAATGSEWKPGCTPPAAAAAATPPPASAGGDLYSQVEAAGNAVRKLKGEKADKATIGEAVKVLLDLKAKYKADTGSEWKPGQQPVADVAAVAANQGSNNAASDLEKELGDRIVAQGELVRKLKGDKADKADIDANVQILLGLKGKYKEKTGADYKPPGGGGGGGARKPKEKKEKKEKTPQPEKAKPAAGVTRLGMEAKKEDSLADWYSQIIIKAELLEYYDVSGCYILRPWSYAIWESIQSFFDAEIKKLGVQNCYFPIFVSKAALEREKEHIADFAPEVAWVTKSGDSDLAEPIAVRPTSETVMYPAYAKWIQSHRDLPLKLNQWNNVVRWEFKHPQPFLRTREFLWQEGHSAFATRAEAEVEVMDILNLYKSIYEDLLAIPTVPGRKTEKEKFAGGDYTTTVEAYISSAGRAIQGATSHHLGQNFSKMFEVVYEDPDKGGKKYVYQNSWGITTRTIGVLVMVHGDNKGLVLPPNVASIQVVIVPCGITASLNDEDRKELYKSCQDYEDELKAAGVRVHGDHRENYSPGWKFNHWELKGVPIRLELGPRDVKSGQYVVVRRDTGAKIILKKDALATELPELLKTIQSDMFAKAKKELDENLDVVEQWKDFVSALEKGHLIQAPFCGEKPCEERIKEESQADIEVEPGAPSMGAKSLCIPFKQPKELAKGAKCVFPSCKGKPMKYVMFGRSY